MVVPNQNLSYYVLRVPNSRHAKLHIIAYGRDVEVQTFSTSYDAFKHVHAFESIYRLVNYHLGTSYEGPEYDVIDVGGYAPAEPERSYLAAALEE